MRYKIETERTDLFDTNITITMQVRLDKEVPFGELKSAFDKACSLHEVLNMKVVIAPSGEAYYEENDQPGSSFNLTDLPFAELINANERARFHIEKGEFIRGFAGPDGLVFMMHHLGGDGKSLLYFIGTFMECLSGKECEAVPFANLTTENLPEKSRLPFPYGLLVKLWNSRWQKEKKVFGYGDMDEAYTRFWKDRKTVVSLKRYEKEELDLLIRRSKEASVSLTAYLITDLIKDIDREADVGIAVDGRLDGNHSMGNQATGISVTYRYDPERSFDDNARKVHALMRRKLDNDKYRYFVLQFMGRLDPTLTDALNLERAGYFSSRISEKVAGYLGYGDKVKDISITNLTRADIPLKYGQYRISDIVFVPPVVSYGKNIIGVITAGDHMNVIRHVYK